MAEAIDPTRMPSAWGVRLAMASRGWISRTRLMHGSEPREPFFQIWFERWDWHGRRCDSVTFHSGCSAPLADMAGTSTSMLNRIRRAAARALEAWERFPDSIPQQDADGGLSEEPIATRIIFRESYRAPDAPPTERLPEDVAAHCPPRGGDDLTLVAALRLVGGGMNYEDVLTWIGRTPGERRADRIWGLDHKVTLRDWHGEQLALKRLKFGCDTLSEQVVALAMDGTRDIVAKLAEAYRPGGPLGNLPPGFELLSDRILAREAEDRAKDACHAVQRGDHVDNPEGVARYLLGQWHARWEGSRTLSGKLPQPTSEDVAAALAAAAAAHPGADALPLPPGRHKGAPRLR